MIHREKGWLAVAVSHCHFFVLLKIIFLLTSTEYRLKIVCIWHSITYYTYIAILTSEFTTYKFACSYFNRVLSQVEPSLCYGKYNNSVHNHMFNTIHNIHTYLYSGKVYDGIHMIAIASKFSFIVMSGKRASLKRRSASTESSSLVSNSLQQPVFFYKIKEMVHSSLA